MYFLCNSMFLFSVFKKKSTNGETQHLLKSGMDIFYLMRKKDVRVFNRGVPFLFCL